MMVQSMLPIIGGLIGILAIMVAASRLLPFGWQRSQPRPGRTLALRESIALDPRRRIHLVECGQKRVLLLTGGEQDLVIGWMPDA